jgi:hypothetical protein
LPAAVSFSPQSTGPSHTPIAGSVLPIRRAEELLTTLPGVLSAKIVASSNGAVDEIHVLTTSEYTPKQTVRNIESALIAHLGMRVDHRKISVAASSERPAPAVPVVTEPAPPTPGAAAANQQSTAGAGRPGASAADAATGPRSAASAPASGPVAGGMPVRERVVASGIEFEELLREVDSTLAGVVPEEVARRRLYFEDVEVRRSRARGVLCRVTLRKGDMSYTGDAEGLEGSRARVDLAARAALKAIAQAEHGERTLALDGVKLIQAFDREFVFVGVAAQVGRERAMLTGSCEVRESPEQASVLAALDATNRWIGHDR